MTTWCRPARLSDLTTEQLHVELDAERRQHPHGSPRLRQLTSLLEIRTDRETPRPPQNQPPRALAPR